MARTFTSTPSYASVDTAVITAYPLTMACWFYAANTSNEFPLIWVGDRDTTQNFTALHARGSQEGDPIAAFSHLYGAAATGMALSSSGYSATTWTHACGVWTSVSARAAYLNGGSKGTDATTVGAMIAHDRTSVGAYRDSTPTYQAADCSIAEAAIWNVALTDEEVASLGDGWSPLLVRPASLVFYAPLIGYGSPEPEIIGGNSLTLTGTPAAAAHPRMVYSQRHRIYVPKAATTVNLHVGTILKEVVL